MSDYPLTLTEHFKASISRVTWDSRKKGPAVVTVWVRELPVFTYPTGQIMGPYDTLTFTIAGREWEVEDVNPTPPVRPQSLRRRFSRWINS